MWCRSHNVPEIGINTNGNEHKAKEYMMPLTGLRRKWLWPSASPEGEFKRNSQVQEGWYEGGRKFQLAICQPPNLNTKCQHMLELTKCPHDISYHSVFLTLHNLHIYKWYIDNFLKRRLHPSSSFIYYHISQSTTIFYFLFFFFSLPFRGLATKCDSAMLKPKGISDCVPKYLLLVTL